MQNNSLTVWKADRLLNETLEWLHDYEESSGEVGLRNTIVWCGERTASSGFSLETMGKYVQI